MSAIADLAENRVVEGTYAVARKERRRTRTGSDYLALELVDPSGKIEARVWNDVQLLDSRFGEPAHCVNSRISTLEGGVVRQQMGLPAPMADGRTSSAPGDSTTTLNRRACSGSTRRDRRRARAI